MLRHILFFAAATAVMVAAASPAECAEPCVTNPTNCLSGLFAPEESTVLAQLDHNPQCRDAVVEIFGRLNDTSPETYARRMSFWMSQGLGLGGPGTSAHSMGHHDQCVSDPKMQFCVAGSGGTSPVGMIGTQFSATTGVHETGGVKPVSIDFGKANFNFNTQLSGVCMPAACSPCDIQCVILPAYFHTCGPFIETVPAPGQTLFFEAADNAPIFPNVVFIDCGDHEQDWTWKSAFVVGVGAFFGLLCVIGTVVHSVAIVRRATIEAEQDDHNSVIVNQPAKYGAMQDGQQHDESSSQRPLLSNGGGSSGDHKSGRRDSGFWVQFSLVANWQRLVAPRPSRGLEMLDGVRFMSMAWVILGHTYFFSQFSLFGVKNQSSIDGGTSFVRNWAFSVWGIEWPAKDFGGVLAQWWFQIINQAFFAVDSFFWLSGLLAGMAIIGLFRKLRDDGHKMAIVSSTGIMYLHRWLRLTPVYMFLLFVYWQVFPLVGSGPAWLTTVEGNKACATYWWTNLVYLNNLLPWGDNVPNQCMGWTWYLANDMQFFWITPIIAVLFVYRRWLGSVFLTLLIGGSLFANGFISQHYDLPANTLSWSKQGAELQPGRCHFATLNWDDVTAVPKNLQSRLFFTTDANLNATSPFVGAQSVISQAMTAALDAVPHIVAEFWSVATALNPGCEALTTGGYRCAVNLGVASGTEQDAQENFEQLFDLFSRNTSREEIASQFTTALHNLDGSLPALVIDLETGLLGPLGELRYPESFLSNPDAAVKKTVQECANSAPTLGQALFWEESVCPHLVSTNTQRCRILNSTEMAAIKQCNPMPADLATWLANVQFNIEFELPADCLTVPQFESVKSQGGEALQHFRILQASVIKSVCHATNTCNDPTNKKCESPSAVSEVTDKCARSILAPLDFSAPKENSYAKYIYFKPWTRALPYLVGVALAMLLDLKAHQLDDKYNQANNRLSNLSSWAVQGLGLAILATLVFVQYDEDRALPRSVWSQPSVDAWTALSRFGWGIGLSLLFLSIRFGPRWGLIRWLLSRPIFSPLGKLTFTAYLIHPMVLEFFFQTQLDRFVFTPARMLFMWLGFTFVAYSLATVAFLFIEKPVMNLENRLLSRFMKRG